MKTNKNTIKGKKESIQRSVGNGRTFREGKTNEDGKKNLE